VKPAFVSARPAPELPALGAFTRRFWGKTARFTPKKHEKREILQTGAVATAPSKVVTGNLP
jgi:hypothetical protein